MLGGEGMREDNNLRQQKYVWLMLLIGNTELEIIWRNETDILQNQF